MPDLPPVNSLVYVAVSEEITYRSRVEDAAEDTLTVAAPIGAGDLDVPPIGSEVAVFWAGTRTRYILPVRMIGITRECPARWAVQAVGAPRTHTRRRFVRGGGNRPAKLIKSGEAHANPLDGVIADISEAGLRCRVPGGDVTVGDRVHVRMTLDEEAIDLIGTVYTVRQDTEQGGWDVVIIYDLPEATAQRIRRYVYAWELAERRRLQDTAD